MAHKDTQATGSTNTTRTILFSCAASLALTVACVSKTDTTTVIEETAPTVAEAPEEAALETIVTTGSKRADGFAGDSSFALMAPPMMMAEPAPVIDRDRYEDVEPNTVKLVSEDPVSTFSVDVDTAAYANVRRFLNDGVLPPRDAVRIEEMINYFDYAYPETANAAAPFATHVSVTPSPWSTDRKLMHVGLKGFDLKPTEQPPINLTLLVDVSGSMKADDKLPLARKALKLLVDQLDKDDRVSIVVYAGAAGAVLDPTPGNESAKIAAALDNLSAGGSTAGGEGLRLAYSLAEQNLDPNAINRIMLLTDGDFNLGVTSDERLEDFVARKRESGIYLSVLGFGRGNYNDAMMQKIAQAGNGLANYIDTLNEARKVLSDDLSGSLFPIAKDVKIQVEFNPAKVQEYRLIGYETRLLNREDFDNDNVDAGDIGAGHTVTAIYEITPVGSSNPLIAPSRYQPGTTRTDQSSNETAFIKLRYKLPDEDKSRLMSRAVTSDDEVQTLASAPIYTRMAAAVAGFGQLISGSTYLSDDFDYDRVISIANGARGEDEFGYRSEFVQLVRAAKTASALETFENSTGAGEDPSLH